MDVVIGIVTVADELMTSLLRIHSAVEQRPVRIDFVFDHLYPLDIVVLASDFKTGVAAVGKVLEQGVAKVIGVGPGTIGIIVAGLHHHAAVVHQLGNGILLRAVGAGGVAQRHQGVVVIVLIDGVGRNVDRLPDFGFVAVAANRSLALFRPLVEAADYSHGGCNAAGQGPDCLSALGHFRTEQIVRRVLTPLGGLEQLS